ALVTGATGGIGRAVCLRLAREGVAVVAAGRDREKLAEVVEELEGLGGVAWSVEIDLADPASIAAGAAEARELSAAIGPITWLVNNAGIAISAPLVEKDREAAGDLYERHMDVNFHGARHLFESLLPGMLRAERGVMINVASSAGLFGYAYVAAYCASKHALVGYTRAAALELAKKGVRANAVCPHYVDSPMTEASVRRVVETTGKSAAEAREFFAAQNPGGRLVTPEEVADAVWELLRSESNGRVVELDGSGSMKDA
ncbi:MAG: SDR family oxidoreductase, partial [Planctomycetes bacterium]|nr:SDR family oxidoreductase [Planctomycetota bacterium]